MNEFLTNGFQFESNAALWKRQWENHVWRMQGLKWMGSDKVIGTCDAAKIANAMYVIAEALKL